MDPKTRKTRFSMASPPPKFKPLMRMLVRRLKSPKSKSAVRGIISGVCRFDGPAEPDEALRFLLNIEVLKQEGSQYVRNLDAIAELLGVDRLILEGSSRNRPVMRSGIEEADQGEVAESQNEIEETDSSEGEEPEPETEEEGDDGNEAVEKNYKHIIFLTPAEIWIYYHLATYAKPIDDDEHRIGINSHDMEHLAEEAGGTIEDVEAVLERMVRAKMIVHVGNGAQYRKVYSVQFDPDEICDVEVEACEIVEGLPDSGELTVAGKTMSFARAGKQLFYVTPECPNPIPAYSGFEHIRIRPKRAVFKHPDELTIIQVTPAEAVVLYGFATEKRDLGVSLLTGNARKVLITKTTLLVNLGGKRQAAKMRFDKKRVVGYGFDLRLKGSVRPRMGTVPWPEGRGKNEWLRELRKIAELAVEPIEKPVKPVKPEVPELPPAPEPTPVPEEQPAPDLANERTLPPVEETHPPPELEAIPAEIVVEPERSVSTATKDLMELFLKSAEIQVAAMNDEQMTNFRADLQALSRSIEGVFTAITAEEGKREERRKLESQAKDLEAQLAAIRQQLADL